MRKVVIGMAVVVMALGSVTNAYIYEQVAVKDAGVESGAPNASLGADEAHRGYPEFNGGDPDGKGIRPGLYQWDLSSIPTGSTIVSATLHLYLDKAGTPPSVEDYSVSRLLPGKSWHESDGYYEPAPAGYTTWNDQIVGTAAWDGGGAGGAADVDKTDVKYFDAIYAGEDLQIALDIKSFVTEWVTNGVENNGIVQRGGTIAGAVSGGNRWEIGHRENVNEIERPYLTVEWVPEPASALFLALGIVPILRRRR